MQLYKNLEVEKISYDCFYCPSDSGYFNQWTKLFILSAKEHAPWAKVHVHIFDITEDDKRWCEKNSVSYTYETTPEEFSSTIETKKDFWVNIRFCRIPEIFQDNVTVLSIDSDSLFNKKLELEEFKSDTVFDWVAVRDKGNGSLGSCVLFSKDSPARHILRDRLISHWGKDTFKWYLDQEILDQMLEENLIKPFSMKYTDYTCKPFSTIWTGKGDRKFKKHFPILANKYRKLLDRK